MNHCVPNWNLEEDDSRAFPDLLHAANQKKYFEPNCEVVELLWQNGQVILNNQTHRKPILASNESQQAHHKPDQPSKFCNNSFGNSTNSIQEDETASWLQYPLDDPLENEFCSDFFQENTMPPPESQVTDSIPQGPCAGDASLVNFSQFSRPIKTLGSSNCKSDQDANEADLSRVSCDDGAVKEDVQKMLIQSGRGQTDTLEPTATSSSGGSAGNLGRTVEQSNSNQSQKRKGRDGDESECQSEVNEYESIEAKKPLRRSASSRRSRAAEVHNLSERKRRDRINEKMKALKDLIPNCNKTDKASMLDEAIEYLKSLQLQLQMMWMGRGMVPMMFPGIQHYMPHMGMEHTSLPPTHSLVPRDPMVDQSITSTPATNYPAICPSTSFNPVNFQTANLPDSYAGYLGFHHMQTAPQGMNLFPYGRSSSSSGHCSGGGLPDNSQKGK